MLSEAMQLLQMADKPTLRGYLGDTIPDVIRRFINQFLVLEDPKDMVFHGMAAAPDPRKHSFVAEYLSPPETAGPGEMNLEPTNIKEEHHSSVPLLGSSMGATHQRAPSLQHLQPQQSRLDEIIQPYICIKK